MPIQFFCQKCGQRFQVQDSMAGKQASCKRCGAVLTVPHPEPLDELQPISPQAHSPLVPTSPVNPLFAGSPVRQTSSGLPPAAWVAIGVAVAVLFMIVGGVLLRRGSNPDAMVAANRNASNPANATPSGTVK